MHVQLSSGLVVDDVHDVYYITTLCVRRFLQENGDAQTRLGTV